MSFHEFTISTATNTNPTPSAILDTVFKLADNFKSALKSVISAVAD